MIEPGSFRLKPLRDLFPRISWHTLGSPNMAKLEEAFRPLAVGEEDFSVKHLETLKDEKHRYWNFLDWWRLPELNQSSLSNLRELLRLPRPPAIALVEGLFKELKNVEIVSCLLRFIDPVSFGILSPPVENLLNIRGNTPLEKYGNYLEALRELRDEYGFSRNCDVDMALWTLAHILNYNELRAVDPECREVADSYSSKPSLIKRIAARNSLQQFFDDKDYLNIADMFIESDHTIAAFIGGREIERVLRKLCKKHKIKPTEICPDGIERNKRVSTMVNELHDCLRPEERHNLKQWYRKRSDLVHDRREISPDEICQFIKGLREIKTRLSRTS